MSARKDNSSKNNDKVTDHCIDFHGAAIINQDGREVAITEDMVNEACNKLMNDDDMTPYREKQPV